MVAYPKMKREEIEREPVSIKDGIIDIKLAGEIPKKAYFNVAVDIGAFYKEFHSLLQTNWENLEFIDVHGKTSEKKKGKFLEYSPPISEYKDPQGGPSRPPGIYEHHYVWAKHNGFDEHETRWFARVGAKYSQRAWYEFKLQIDVRNIVEREILDGNKKKKLYYGTWELRNEMHWKSSIILDFFHKTPIIQNSPMLQELYLDFIHYRSIKADLIYQREKLIPMLYSVINKHFKPGSENNYG